MVSWLRLNEASYSDNTVYSEQPSLFEAVPREQKRALNPRQYGLDPKLYEVYFLGAGSSGGVFYVKLKEEARREAKVEFVQKKRRSIALKRFFNPHDRGDVHKGIDNEELKYKVLGEVVDRIKDKEGFSVFDSARVVDLENLDSEKVKGEDVLTLSYSRGKNLRDILNDPEKTDINLLMALAQNFNYGIDQLVKELKADPRFTQVGGGDTTTYSFGAERFKARFSYKEDPSSPGEGEPIDIDIRPDQVVVSPDDLSMTIIDWW